MSLKITKSWRLFMSMNVKSISVGFNKNLGSPQRYKAFTLAEVLITLGIIGVVAAMTIPSLLNKTNDSESKTAVKKTYSVLYQAYNLIKNDNGGTVKGICTDGDLNCIRDLFAAKMQVIKKCDVGNNENGGCWPYHHYLGTGAVDVDYNDRAGMVLNDGVSITFFSYHAACAETQEMISDTGKYCSQIVININGLKKPNMVGKDIFAFRMADTTLAPYGAEGNFEDIYSPGQANEANKWDIADQYLYNK